MFRTHNNIQLNVLNIFTFIIPFLYMVKEVIVISGTNVKLLVLSAHNEFH